MQYTLIDSADVPGRMPQRAKRRNPEIQDMLDALTPGKVAQITVDQGTKGRNVVFKIMQTAARRRMLVDVWEVGGALYVELVPPADAP